MGSASRQLRRQWARDVNRLANETGLPRDYVEQAAREYLRSRLPSVVADVARRLPANPPPSTGVAGELCSCGCGKPLQRLPNGQLGVVTYSIFPDGERHNLPIR